MSPAAGVDAAGDAAGSDGSGHALPLTAGPYLSDKLRALDARLRELVPRILSPDRDDEAVHDLRVALRRTRTVLGIGRPVFGRFRVDHVRDALRALQAATGALRDEEVLLQLLTSLGVAHEGVQRWIEARRRRERALRRALKRAVETGELDRGRGLLAALLAFPVNPRRDRRLSKFARRAVSRARRRVERRRGAPVDDAAALHGLRIAYKRLRYAAETFAEVLPDDLARLAHPAARLQNRLGAVHDADVALACVRRARSLTADARAELLRALEKLREERVAAYALAVGRRRARTASADQASGTDALRKTSTR
ncbi:MAG TPA: CHAD domain-containing protein [Polyangiaceae bacterium]|nr:CHAD domain-containing protein [Polyangiaceae bacterium]